jgi:hypothetical protein
VLSGGQHIAEGPLLSVALPLMPQERQTRPPG